ncbi:DNA segregation ATPase FtsK/SpoIIIE and related protein [Candidatus Vecturithrix granuli]|uniref:DNA segregation ATPase FtsK/SpoIIIE and related protein n=1 Tax=Vecturithrix granuli TaxID=1499967 RepID=A0A081C8V8_VECG1|nr:DNA segregation ATPase FtsK/SpoIIIE and related protein [Candidatus Vecturithrix granuli]
MRIQQLRGIVILVSIILVTVLYAMIFKRPQPTDPALQYARIRYQIEEFEQKRATLKRNSLLKFYGSVGVLITINTCLLILVSGYIRAKLKAASVCQTHIGQHSVIPIHYKDLQRFYPIAVNLSLAEIEASLSTSHETAYQISRQMLEDMTNYTHTISGKHEKYAFAGDTLDRLQSPLSLSLIAPTCAALLHEGMLAPGKPLLIGYSQGQPQYRTLQDLKSMAIAGWQGSGKTLSTAYLIAASVLAYGAWVYVIDPHKHHPESLSSLISPLETSGLVSIINPFHTPALIQNLHRILDRRLAGEESGEPPILLVIDELARLVQMDCFEELLAFLERCTEETRKANITFLGSSPKWTARYFRGRADIRGCMNSMLIHKTKPSQADLLLEDAHDKQLVKQLQRPGEAILATDYAPPILVSIPLCTRSDIHTVAALVKEQHVKSKSQDFSEREFQYSVQGKNLVELDETMTTELKQAAIPFEKTSTQPGYARPKVVRPGQLSLEMLQEQLKLLKQRYPNLTQAEIAREAGLSPSLLSKILNGQRPLKEEYQWRLSEVLRRYQKQEKHAMVG